MISVCAGNDAMGPRGGILVLSTAYLPLILLVFIFNTGPQIYRKFEDFQSSSIGLIPVDKQFANDSVSHGPYNVVKPNHQFSLNAHKQNPQPAT